MKLWKGKPALRIILWLMLLHLISHFKKTTTTTTLSSLDEAFTWFEKKNLIAGIEHSDRADFVDIKRQL